MTPSELKRLKANELVERNDITLDFPLSETSDVSLFAWLKYLGYRWDGEEWRG